MPARVPLVLVLLACFGCGHAGIGVTATTEIVSVNSVGELANGDSWWPSISADGRFIAFVSVADNLVAGDANGAADVFIRDRVAGETKLVSRTQGGKSANGESWAASMSADGRYVPFSSNASDLVDSDSNDVYDIFLYDGGTETIVRVSLSSSGEQADGDSWVPFVSRDGRYVSYQSTATNLVPGDTNDFSDVFVCDTVLRETRRVSVASDGSQADHLSGWGAISGDGSRVAFHSYASNLVAGDGADGDVFVHDLATGETFLASLSTDGRQGFNLGVPSISGNGRYVAFASPADVFAPGDTNRVDDIFRRDTVNAETTRVSLAWNGVEGNAESWVGYSISDDGSRIAFFSDASNLVPGDTNGCGDIFLRDVARGNTSRLSVSSGAAQAGNGSPADTPSMSRDTRYVAFSSGGGSIIDFDNTNGIAQVFLRDRLTFQDVPLDQWAFYEVGACNMANIVQGYPDGLYRPGLTITRDQMAVYISRALSGGEEYVPTGPAQATFPDVPTDYWAYDHIEYAVTNSVVQGYEDGNYHPDWELTRGQMAVFIARSVVRPTGEAGLATYEPPAVASFPDVPTTYWCYKHVEYCKGRGIVAGYPDGTYKPTQYVTRDQMAVYIQRAFQLPL